VLPIPQDTIEDEAARIEREAAIITGLDAEMAKDIARERRLAGQRIKAAAVLQRRWERAKRREGARVMREFERLSRELPALLDATEAYRQNGDDSVLQPSGETTPSRSFSTSGDVLACCEARLSPTDRISSAMRSISWSGITRTAALLEPRKRVGAGDDDLGRVRVRRQCRRLLARSPSQPAAAAGAAGDVPVGRCVGARHRLSTAITTAPCSA
jgi:hypothetical protein